MDITDKAIEYLDDVKAIAPDRPMFCTTHRLRARPTPGARNGPTGTGAGSTTATSDAGADPGPAEGDGTDPPGHRNCPHSPGRHPRDPHRPRRTPFPPLDFTPPLGHPHRRRETALRPDGRGIRGIRLALRRPDRRLLAYLGTEQLDNTIIVLVSDNGASGEGGPTARSTRTRCSTACRTNLAENLKMLDELGSTTTTTTTPTVGDGVQRPVQDVEAIHVQRRHLRPCIISWPGGIGRGETRDQYHHGPSTWCRPCSTALGIELPDTVKGTPSIRCRG
ncbi:sulfatase-like hydrolase/transferase [Rhodococcus opacus]|nr:sulfatase-like hydrolase/transferase [Rhodococcus opacus]